MRSGQDRLTCMYGDVAQMVERSLSMWEVGGSIPPVSRSFFFFFLCTLVFFSSLSIPLVCFRFVNEWTQLVLYERRRDKRFASSGNRTRAARVAGEHSTTEPTMLDIRYSEIASWYLFWSGGWKSMATFTYANIIVKILLMVKISRFIFVSYLFLICC